MHKIKIGFIGGCINNQKNIGTENLYHAELLNRFSKSNLQFDFQISLATYHSYDQLIKKTEQIILTNHLNIIYIFIRPFPFMPLQKPLVKYNKSNGEKGWSLHPGLFNRKLKWPGRLTEHQRANDYVFVPKNKIELRDLNLFGGIILGLHQWALKYVTAQLNYLLGFCFNHDVKPVLISPPKNPESLMGNLVCRWSTNYFQNYCAEKRIDFINIYSFGIENFERDKIHLNITGHQKLSNLIYTHLQKEEHKVLCNILQ